VSLATHLIWYSASLRYDESRFKCKLLTHTNTHTDQLFTSPLTRSLKTLSNRPPRAVFRNCSCDSSLLITCLRLSFSHSQPSLSQASITMWILPLLGYTGVIFGFSFLTLAIGNHLRHSLFTIPASVLTLTSASGLYYLSELVEEHTVISQKLLTRLIQVIIAAHILLIVFDGFPVMLTLFSAASHGVYLMNVTRTFPMGMYNVANYILLVGYWNLITLFACSQTYGWCFHSILLYYPFPTPDLPYI